MKLFQAVLYLSAISLKAKADNTEDLCTDGIEYLERIKPSATALHQIPNITVGGFEYSGDEDHFVVRPPLEGKDRTYKHVLVYIPGTTDRPELSSCLIKSAQMALDIPILALSYQYLSSGDSFRNGKCEYQASVKSAAEQINCLTQHHVDAIEGGDYGATNFNKENKAFWDEVLPENSLKQRLGDLFAYLHTEYPTEGWNEFLMDPLLFGGSNFPRWDNIIVSGHSQGAGHAAYLAKTETLHGAVMISGPQDECKSCADGTTFWIDEGPYLSSDAIYTALGHGNEPLFSVMQDNWRRMKEATPSINWETADPSNVGFALETEVADAYASPLQTDVAFANTSTCGGEEHCSTAIDDSVPFLETFDDKKLYLYDKAVWPSLLMAATAKTGKSKDSKARKLRTRL